VKHFDSGAVLQGKLYDDKGNLMGPSFSSKNGVRYRFYVSSALLRGRKAGAGSVGRVSATLVENAVRSTLASHQQAGSIDDAPLEIEQVQRVVVARDRLSITFLDSKEDGTKRQIQVPWSCAPRDGAVVIDSKNALAEMRDEGLIQAIVRAHVWLQQLADGTHDSVEELAESNGIHPKVIRQALRLASLSPEIASVILEGKQPSTLTLARIPKLLPLPWATQRRLLAQ
jgi:site-specific DNA recombinase